MPNCCLRSWASGWMWLLFVGWRLHICGGNCTGGMRCVAMVGILTLAIVVVRGKTRTVPQQWKISGQHVFAKNLTAKEAVAGVRATEIIGVSEMLQICSFWALICCLRRMWWVRAAFCCLRSVRNEMC
mmetsp:Transcript_62130/g.115268  ORF Transcript_62130/g.115268 Transcript_62130/m.115268 type:complete len:128 (+) Transcript_62130:77-460(+)